VRGILRKWLNRKGDQNKDGPTEQLINQTATANLPVTLSDTQRRAEIEMLNAHKKRLFQTDIVGDLNEPEVRSGIIITGYLTTIISFILFVLLNSPLMVLLSLTICFFAFGIRKIRTVHCGLLYMLGQRTRIGFWEGFVWVPWFLGGVLKEFNVERFTFDIAREDFWSKDSMHIITDLVFRSSVAPVVEKPFWKNFFWFFLVRFKMVYYLRLRHYGADLGAGLFRFIQNADVENVIELVMSRVKQATRQVLRTKGFEDIFHFTNEGIEANADSQKEVESEIKQVVNKLIRDTGLSIDDVSLSDLDFHPEVAQALQQRKIAPWLADALQKEYDKVIEIAKSLNENPEVGETALRIETIVGLKKSAKSGLLGSDRFMEIVQKALNIENLSEIPRSKKTVKLIT